MISFPSVIDNSMRTTFAQCPQKFFYTYLDHWKKKTTNVHLHAGGAFARGIEVARRSFYIDHLPHDQAVLEGWKALVESYGQYNPDDGEVKTVERMASALTYYFDVWPMDQDFVHPYTTETGRRVFEFSFVHPLPINHPTTGEPILYYGRFDMIGQHQNGELYVVDEKTTKQLGQSWVESWKLDSQFTGYCWGARQFNLPVVGAIIRGISILKNGHGHAQSIQTRPQWMIDEWLDQLCDDINLMIQMWKRDRFARSFGPGCKMYGGCHFRDVCASIPHNRQTWLEADFHQQEYQPWENA